MRKGVTKKGLTLLLFLMTTAIAYGQYNVQHQAPIAIERGQANALEFIIPGLSQSEIQQARIFYRYDGDFSYQQQEIDFQNGTFRTLFYIDNENASTLEYYFEVTLNSGEGIHFPGNLPSENPVEVEIVEELQEEEKRQLQGVDYTILSPEQGGGVSQDNVIIAVALFYDIESLEPGEFRLLIDQMDVTSQADTSAYYISYAPPNLRRGPHTVAIEYQTEDERFAVIDWDFTVVAPGQASFQAFGASNIPQGNIELSARNQVIAGDLNNAYNGRTRVSGRYGLLRYSVNGYLTSQESARLQPQNRYGVNLTLGKWWKFDAGHVYPSMSQFTISGRRVHGLNTSLHLINENLNFHFMYGELDRSITNQYDSLIVREVLNSNGEVVDNNYFLTYQDGGRGTFQRKIMGGRVSFGREEAFQLGFNALKVQDDTSSIFNVRDYLDIRNSDVTLNSNLDQQHIDSLLANPDLLDVSGGTVRPRDNIIAGTDLKFAFNNNRIRFQSEAAISALNNNIYGGPLDAERADELGFDIDQKVTDLLEKLSWIIIINENMSTLPLRIEEDDNGDLDAVPFFPTSILGGNSELSVRYPSNSFRLQYRWIGPDFNSLANSTIRKDIAGFTLTDRLNLFSNRIYLTLGYENLNDNVSGNRDATTETETYRTNLSWYPIDRSLPRINAGVRYRTRDNGIARENVLVEQISEDLITAAVRNIRINADGDTVSTPTPRSNYTVNLNASITQQFGLLNARNDISLNLTNINTTDEVFAFGDVTSTAISLNLNSRFSAMPLETQVGYTFNNTESGSGQNQINIKGFHMGGNIFLFENRLNINGRLAFTNNATSTRLIEIRDNPNSDELNDDPRDDYYELGDEVTERNFKTYVIQAGARFNIDDNHSVVFDANLTNVSGANNQANDRIVQLRYVFSF